MIIRDAWSTAYDNLSELTQAHPQVARELSARYKQSQGDSPLDDWAYSEMLLYNSIDDLIMERLTDWYNELTTYNDDNVSDLDQYVDIPELGKKVMANWDSDEYFQASNGMIVDCWEYGGLLG